MRIVDLRADRTDDAVALWHASSLTRPWTDPNADLTRALTGPASTVLAAHAGVPKVNLMVRTTNAAVVAFYESLCYEDGDVVVLGTFLHG